MLTFLSVSIQLPSNVRGVGMQIPRGRSRGLQIALIYVILFFKGRRYVGEDFVFASRTEVLRL